VAIQAGLLRYARKDEERKPLTFIGAKSAKPNSKRPSGLLRSLILEQSVALPGGRLEVAQNAAERLLAGIVVFPSAKIADMPRPPNVSGPPGTALHYGIVQANRKQDRTFLLLLLLEGGLHLLLDPLAKYRVLGQDQQQPFVDVDSVIDALSELVADLHVLCGEPASHAVVLQVGVQALRELLVLRRVADEARVVLDGLVEQRRQLIDQPIGQTAAAQKGQRQPARPL
jgi:hypothetical protein